MTSRCVCILPLLIFFSLPTICALASPIARAGGEDIRSVESSWDYVRHNAGFVPVVDEYDAAIREANGFYARLVSLLTSVDSPKRYREIEDSLRSMWQSVFTLESRYPALDSDSLNERLSSNAEFQRLQTALDKEGERIRREFPDVALSMDDLIETVASKSSDEMTRTAFKEIMELYEKIVRALEAIETPEDGVNSYDTLHSLALRLKETEAKYGWMKERFQAMMEEDARARDLSERLDASFARMLSDPDMERVFEALEPLATDDLDGDSPTPDEKVALHDYGVALEQAIELLRQVRTTEDIERLSAELLTLTELDRVFNELLPGERGELLIESDPKLARLLQEMGAEQMRIDGDSDLRAGMAILFFGGR